MTFKRIPSTPYEISATGLCRRRKNGRVRYLKLSAARQYSLYYRDRREFPHRSVNVLMALVFDSPPEIQPGDIGAINEEVARRNKRNGAMEIERRKSELTPKLSKRKCARKGCERMGYGYWCDRHRAEHFSEGDAAYGSPLNEYQLPW